MWESLNFKLTITDFKWRYMKEKITIFLKVVYITLFCHLSVDSTTHDNLIKTVTKGCVTYTSNWLSGKTQFYYSNPEVLKSEVPEFLKCFSTSESVCTLVFNKGENPTLQPFAQWDQNQDPFSKRFCLWTLWHLWDVLHVKRGWNGSKVI